MRRDDTLDKVSKIAARISATLDADIRRYLSFRALRDKAEPTKPPAV